MTCRFLVLLQGQSKGETFNKKLNYCKYVKAPENVNSKSEVFLYNLKGLGWGLDWLQFHIYSTGMRVISIFQSDFQ